MTKSIEGIWRSYYEYGRGPDDEPQASEYRVRFTHGEDQGKWIGASLPGSEGSEVTITFTQDGNEFAGEWRERTSPIGYYKGREFNGLILLLLQHDDTELNGMWLGAGSSARRVKSGMWTFEREA